MKEYYRESLKCKFCDREFITKSALHNHENLCKLNPNNTRNILDKVCPICGEKFNSVSIGPHILKCRKIHSITKDSENYKSKFGYTLDITNKELEDYKKKVTRCEICGKTLEESISYTGKYSAKSLCIDHEHGTNHFRGLLCLQCNRALGWYENNKENIEKYLKK